MSQFKIESALKQALTRLNVPQDIACKIDIPPRPEFGDYSTNIAIVAAHTLSRPPRELAREIVELIRDDVFSRVEIAGPGFVNFFLKDSFLQETLREIENQDRAWGKSDSHKGEKLLLEFVSANPTGPLHVGHGRWAVIGDVIGRLLEAVGFRVDREFYINNVGNQINLLVGSVAAAREGKPVPEGGYGGAYVKEIAAKLKTQNSKLKTNELLNLIIQEQKSTLANLEVRFDRWFNESELHERNKVKWAVEKLHDIGKTFEEGGAIWFKSQELGDDKNRVLIREDGNPTYFAADIAYHLDKFARGYNRLINIWGTDHHGYVGRLKAALKVLGEPVDRFEIIIGQLVTLYRGDEPVRMSKRTGEMVTLQEVIDEIGADATRFFFSATDVNSHLDFDLELAKKQSSENPVYYVQYAHARICSILRKANVESRAPCLPAGRSSVELGTLNLPAERELMLKLLRWPEVVAAAARLRHPHRVTEYGKELATVFHKFYEQCRVIGDPARLTLVNASRVTLRNVLELLGIAAPETM